MFKISEEGKLVTLKHISASLVSVKTLFRFAPITINYKHNPLINIKEEVKITRTFPIKLFTGLKIICIQKRTQNILRHAKTGAD